MDRPLCIFHSKDHDGHCSAAVVRHKFHNAEFVGLDYGDKFPWNKIPGRDVIMVDYSIGREDTLRLGRKARSLVWIDHHKTAIAWATEEWSAKGRNCKWALDQKSAACELAWLYLFPNETMPRFVHYIGRYDIWDHTDPNVVWFHHGLLGRLTNPELDAEKAANTWNALFSLDQFTDQLVAEGKILKYASRTMNLVYARASCFETTLLGFPAVAINRAGGSELFEGVFDPAKHKLMVAFNWRNGLWDFSLRSVGELDVSEIAARFHGGGGHKNAAGFQTDTLPDGFLR